MRLFACMAMMVAAVFLGGCGGSDDGHDHSGHDHSGHDHSDHDHDAPPASQPAESQPASQPSSSANFSNDVCLVSGHEFDKNSSKVATVTYNGKTYGLCCKSCVPAFKADPAKYALAD